MSPDDLRMIEHVGGWERDYGWGHNAATGKVTYSSFV